MLFLIIKIKKNQLTIVNCKWRGSPGGGCEIRPREYLIKAFNNTEELKQVPETGSQDFGEKYIHKILKCGR